MKNLILILLFCISLSAHSSECANSVSDLKILIGNSDLPLKWFEVGKNPLTLKIQNSKAGLSLNLTKDGEPWADVVGEICKKDSHFVAKAKQLTWGSAAPGVAKKAKFKEFKIQFPYQSLMKVSIFMFSFKFEPLD